MDTAAAEIRSAEKTLAQAVVRQRRGAGGYGETLELGLKFALEDLAPGVDWDATEELDEMRETVLDQAETLARKTRGGHEVDTGAVERALATLGVQN